MKAVKVQYTVRKEFAEQNISNIAEVMNDLRQLNNSNIKYSTFILDDEKSFVHFAMTKSSEANSILNSLDSFKKFQLELKASIPAITKG